MDLISFLSSRYNVEIRKVPVSLIQRRIDLYPRVSLDTEIIKLYGSAMKAGEKFPPVVLTRDYVLVDGFHRTDASVLIGRKEVDAVVIQDELTPQEVLSLSVELNLRHGKRLTNDDIKRVKRMINKEEVLYVFSKYAQTLFNLNLGDLSSGKMVFVKGDFDVEEEEKKMAAFLDEKEDEKGSEEFEELSWEEKKEEFYDSFEEEVDSGNESWGSFFSLKKSSLVKSKEEEEEEEERLDDVDVLFREVEKLKKEWIKQTYGLYATVLAFAKKVDDEKFVAEYVGKLAIYTLLYAFTLLRDYFDLTSQQEKFVSLNEFVKRSREFFASAFEEVWSSKESEWGNMFKKFFSRTEKNS